MVRNGPRAKTKAVKAGHIRQSSEVKHHVLHLLKPVLLKDLNAETGCEGLANGAIASSTNITGRIRRTQEIGSTTGSLPIRSNTTINQSDGMLICGGGQHHAGPETQFIPRTAHFTTGVKGVQLRGTTTLGAPGRIQTEAEGRSDRLTTNAIGSRPGQCVNLHMGGGAGQNIPSNGQEARGRKVGNPRGE